MKLNEKLLAALTQQVTKELYSAYLYRSIASDMKAAGFRGYAAWLEKQYKEEVEHAEKFIGYIEDRGDVVDFGAIDAVEKHFTCPLEAAKAALAHEEYISGSIRDLFKLARAEGDLETEVFLQWFITEQVEEEVNANDNVQGFTAGKDCKGLAYMFDASLAKR